MSTAPRHTAVRLDRTFPSTLEQVDEICREMRAFLHAHGAGQLAFVVELIGRESLNNAVIHGNGRDGRKTVRFGLRLGTTHVRMSVADEGAGFDWRRGLEAGPPGEFATNGRGLPILAMYADRVRYNEPGNRLTVWIPRRPREE
jgi:anti-sigma regulatory factor (Ser/Thr protein kinase)